jgi:hypothetical protein
MEDDLSTIVNQTASSKLGAVYNAVVDFIKWYNEQNY